MPFDSNYKKEFEKIAKEFAISVFEDYKANIRPLISENIKDELAKIHFSIQKRSKKKILISEKN